MNAPNDIGFVQQLWRFKRRERTTEPNPEVFGLELCVAHSLARQVQIEFERQVRERTMEINRALNAPNSVDK